MNRPEVEPASTGDLRDGVAALWQTLLDHPFPRGVADGSLPPERFRFYVAQNLLYLPEYARMLAVGASRSADLTGLFEYTDALVNIVQVEIPQNERMLTAVEELAGARPEAEDVAAPATVAYASWLMSIASTGSADDIAAALLPCAWSYGEIATRLAPATGDVDVYAAWIDFFASAEYAAVVATLRSSFDRSLAAMTPAARQRAAGIFRTGCRLEASFWDQGLSGRHWPDLSD